MPPAESVEYIEAKNDLRRKVRRIQRLSPSDDPVRRAEAALKLLSVQFENWMLDSVSRIAFARDAWADAGHGEGEDKRVFFRAVHDLKGQAATLGFPLATQIATSLCALLEQITARDLLPIKLIDQHVEALRAIVRENARNPEDRIGAELTRTLIEMADSYIARHHGGRESDKDAAGRTAP